MVAAAAAAAVVAVVAVVAGCSNRRGHEPGWPAAAHRRTQHAPGGYLGTAATPRPQAASARLIRAAISRHPPLAKCQVITGFLGAGKTTLVNYVLNEVSQ